MNPDISVVIVNWNVRDLLAATLAGLAAATQPRRFETIVIDNASTDGSADRVEARFLNTILIRNTINAGYARANNQGIERASGRYVLLLNADTVIPAGALAQLVDFMDRNPLVGACSPRLCLPNGKAQPYAFGDDPTPGYLLRRNFNRILGRRPMHDWETDRSQAVDWVSGACMLLRCEGLDDTGGLDENIFMYFEDVDLCLRLRQKGWQVWHVPQVEITHLGGQSLRQNPAAQRAYAASLRYFYAKHYGTVSRLFLALTLPIYTRLSNASPDQRQA